MNASTAIKPESVRYLANFYRHKSANHQVHFTLAIPVRADFMADSGRGLHSCEPSLFLWPCLGSPLRK